MKAIKNTSDESQRLLLELRDTINEKSRSMENGVQCMRKRIINTDKQAILNWLSPVNYAFQQSDFLSRRQEGTGQWLLSSTEFQQWCETRKQNLFCTGIPGSGKTILTAIVIERLYDHFKGDAKIGIAYLYCNYQRTEEQETVDLLANVLKQLTQCLPTIPNTLQSLYDNLNRKAARPTLKDITTTISSVVSLQERSFIVVDALDECQPTRNALKLLAVLHALQTDCGLNVFATSRHIPEIVERFNVVNSVLVEIRASDEDLRRYMEEHIAELPRFVKSRVELRNQIFAEIIKFVDGM